MLDHIQFRQWGRKVIDIEKAALDNLYQYVDSVEFAQACELILQCKGKVIVMGMGKSGHIGNKISATFASTGTPAFFVHPGEASHGDLGALDKNDIVLAISNSGESSEILTLLPVIQRMGVPVIAITGKPESNMARLAKIHLCIQVKEEACPLGLAPTSSTTATLVLGDALAITLLQAKGFTRDDFALSHPGGALGRKLLLKVEENAIDFSTIAINKLKPFKFVKHYNLVPFEELPLLLSSTDLHILFQKTDVIDTVMPSKLLGMMASGKPSIVTGNLKSEVATVFKESSGGFYFDGTSVQDIIKHVDILIKDINLRDSLGSNAKSYVKDKFSKNEVLNDFLTELIK